MTCNGSDQTLRDLIMDIKGMDSDVPLTIRVNGVQMERTRIQFLVPPRQTYRGKYDYPRTLS